MLLLRPHHINCIFFYKGLGYSKEFVIKMNEILDILRKNHDSKIKLVVECDALCSNCPNKQGSNICIWNEKVIKLDHDTLHTYNLKEDQEYMFSEIIEKLYKNFDKNKFFKICSSCNWYKEKVCNESLIHEQLIKWGF